MMRVIVNRTDLIQVESGYFKGEKLSDSSFSDWASDMVKIPEELFHEISKMLHWILVAVILFA